MAWKEREFFDYDFNNNQIETPERPFSGCYGYCFTCRKPTHYRPETVTPKATLSAKGRAIYRTSLTIIKHLKVNPDHRVVYRFNIPQVRKKSATL